VNWFIGGSGFLLIWWIVIFAVLPFGISAPAEHEPGRDRGAPARPRLKLKLLITTLIAMAIWLALYWALTSGLIDFRNYS
jgi:predicted secreted protein